MILYAYRCGDTIQCY